MGGCLPGDAEPASELSDHGIRPADHQHEGCAAAPVPMRRFASPATCSRRLDTGERAQGAGRAALRRAAARCGVARHVPAPPADATRLRARGISTAARDAAWRCPSAPPPHTLAARRAGRGPRDARRALGVAGRLGAAPVHHGVGGRCCEGVRVRCAGCVCAYRVSLHASRAKPCYVSNFPARVVAYMRRLWSHGRRGCPKQSVGPPQNLL